MSDDLELRRAVLCGPAAVATLQAQRQQHARLRAQQLQRDQRLVKAIRKAATA